MYIIIIYNRHRIICINHQKSVCKAVSQWSALTHSNERRLVGAESTSGALLSVCSLGTFTPSHKHSKGSFEIQYVRYLATKYFQQAS